MNNFALIGAAGYVAPRHMRAIKETGNRLVAALDKNDSVGVIDNYFPEAEFFTEIERFDRHLDMLRRKRKNLAVDYVSVASPNYLHDAHVRFALRLGAHAICEKPLVLNPWNLEALEEIEAECGRRVYAVLQLRLHPQILKLKQRIDSDASGSIYDIDLTYITSRGRWYYYSWKGDEEKSGGIATNIAFLRHARLGFWPSQAQQRPPEAARSGCGLPGAAPGPGTLVPFAQ
jgi:UDP-N-acetyl-2-amino-2-deoxyglucuronate dehydrogenase